MRQLSDIETFLENGFSDINDISKDVVRSEQKRETET